MLVPGALVYQQITSSSSPKTIVEVPGVKFFRVVHRCSTVPLFCRTAGSRKIPTVGRRSPSAQISVVPSMRRVSWDA